MLAKKLLLRSEITKPGFNTNKSLLLGVIIKGDNASKRDKL